MKFFSSSYHISTRPYKSYDHHTLQTKQKQITRYFQIKHWLQEGREKQIVTSMCTTVIHGAKPACSCVLARIFFFFFEPSFPRYQCPAANFRLCCCTIVPLCSWIRFLTRSHVELQSDGQQTEVSNLILSHTKTLSLNTSACLLFSWLSLSLILRPVYSSCSVSRLILYATSLQILDNNNVLHLHFF
jgi:hypothetical protein